MKPYSKKTRKPVVAWVFFCRIIYDFKTRNSARREAKYLRSMGERVRGPVKVALP